MGHVKFTDEMQIKLCAMVSIGCSVRNAARLVDVKEATVRKAAKKNPEFGARLNNALAQREILPLKNLQTAGAKYWRASAWLLERIDRHAYGRRDPNVISKEQLTNCIEVMTEIIARNVPQYEVRQAISKDLNEIIDQLQTLETIQLPRHLRDDTQDDVTDREPQS